MLIKEEKLKGVFTIDLEPHEDHRGYFMRVYDEAIFSRHEIHRNWVQENQSLSEKKGTIRGLHFQFPPWAETKLVRVISGEIYDIVVDLRRNSPTFGEWDSFRLSADGEGIAIPGGFAHDEDTIKLPPVGRRMLYIPRGFAHGMCTLTDNCIMLYKVDNYYAPESEGSIKWDDPDLRIDWPVDNPILSEKDSRAGSFKGFVETYGRLEEGIIGSVKEYIPIYPSEYFDSGDAPKCPNCYGWLEYLELRRESINIEENPLLRCRDCKRLYVETSYLRNE